MINTIQKNIIIRALLIRMKNGENPEEILLKYTNLSDEEKADILAVIKN